MPTQRSEVWKHFTLSSDKKAAKCNLCDVSLTYAGTTTNLKNHLQGKHPTFCEVKSDSPGAKKQAPMNMFLKQKPATESITRAITSMVVKDYVPLSIVEGEGFRELMSSVAPDFKVPCRNTIRARIVKQYGDEKAQLVTEMADIQSASITTDTWTSNAQDSYLTVTEHHIDKDWNLHSNVLMTRSMPERHTGENLAKKLQECVSEFGLDGKVFTCVHDNARNMECAGDKCDQWQDLGCFGHTLQLCIKPALELQTVSNIIGKCWKLVGHFKHSTTLTAEMRKRQILLDEPKHELIQDVATRWNSTQLMMTRLSEQRRVITDIMLDNKITKKSDTYLLPKDTEWDIICDIGTVLSVLTDVTTYMSVEQNVSCSEIYPIVCGLLSGPLEAESYDSGLVQKVKEIIRGELTRRYQPTTMETAKGTPVLASLLDPRYKRLHFLTDEQRLVAKDNLESHLDEVPLRIRPQLCEVTDTQTPSKRRRLDFTLYRSPENRERDELRNYLSESVDNELEPLKWWKTHERQYPRIAFVARKVLAVPATSVPSERIFSSAGLLVNKLRNRLSCDIVDSIIFLNKNRVSERLGAQMVEEI